jgi:flavin reductase (DIM6/NTAB) family NADH-FMN oxidoreductase RutF
MALARWRRVPISGETYKQIGRASAGAVSIVAAARRGSDAVVGLTVSSFVTLSFEPPLVMFAIQHNADSYATLVASESFGVSLLSVHQSDVARRFALKGTEKCANTRFEMGHVLPVPLIAASLAQIECRTSQIFSSGDHAIVVGLVEAARTRGGEPLLYFARRFGSFTPLATDI